MIALLTTSKTAEYLKYFDGRLNGSTSWAHPPASPRLTQIRPVTPRLLREPILSRINVQLSFIALVAFQSCQPAAAFDVVSDEANFLSLYENPSEVVDFKNPLPGSLTGVSHSLGGGATAFDVRQDGWSELVSVGSVMVGGTYWLTTSWYGDHISPSLYARPDRSINRIYIAFQGAPTPISLTTSAGFIGLVPTSADDTFFALPLDATLSEMSIGYHPIASVPEPTNAALFVLGLGVLVLRLRSRSTVRGAPRESSLFVRPKETSVGQASMLPVTASIKNRFAWEKL